MAAETVVSKSTMGTDVLDMFPGIEAADVLTKPTNILSDDKSLSFIDKPVNSGEDTPEGDDPTKKGPEVNAPADDAAPVIQVKKADADKILDSIGKDDAPATDDDTDDTAPDEDKKAGRGGITSYLKNKIEAGDFSAFDDWDEKKETLDQYLSKQPIKTLHQMLDANWESQKQEILEQTPKEFFEALPEELQYAAKYVMDGGTDMKGLFAALARVEQVKSLDIKTEDGQAATCRAYLQATGFGRGKSEVIEKQVQEWKDQNKLEEKAEEFKPDLDDMQKEQVQYQLQQQEVHNRQRQQAAQAYVGNIHKALEKGDINGIKLDRKTQANLYTGLTQLAYPNAAGKPTNLLGHLLDRIQYTEPNFPLLAEVTYLLSDPEGYRNSVKQMGKNEQVIDTVKKLKTEQQTGGATGAGSIAEEDYNDTQKKTKKLTKPKNVFEGWK